MVEVHQDPEIKDQIIIQYLDQSKDVILQVPSAQELSVERGIVQEFSASGETARQRARGGNASANEGEKSHGD